MAFLRGSRASPPSMAGEDGRKSGRVSTRSTRSHGGQGMRDVLQWDEPPAAGPRPPRQPASPAGQEAAPSGRGRDSEAAGGSRRQAGAAAGGYPAARQVRYAQRHDASQEQTSELSTREQDSQPGTREHLGSNGRNTHSGGACNGSGSRRMSQVSSMTSSDPGLMRHVAAGSSTKKAAYGAGCDPNSVIRVSQEARAQRERAQARNRGGGIFGEDAPMAAALPPQYGGGGGSSAAGTPKAHATAPYGGRGIFSEDAPLPAPPPRHGGNLW